jgi:hypothetical protein
LDTFPNRDVVALNLTSQNLLVAEMCGYEHEDAVDNRIRLRNDHFDFRRLAGVMRWLGRSDDPVWGGPLN